MFIHCRQIQTGLAVQVKCSLVIKDVTPDIMLGKALGGGNVISAIAAIEEMLAYLIRFTVYIL